MLDYCTAARIKNVTPELPQFLKIKWICPSADRVSPLWSAFIIPNFDWQLVASVDGMALCILYTHHSESSSSVVVQQSTHPCDRINTIVLGHPGPKPWFILVLTRQRTLSGNQQLPLEAARPGWMQLSELRSVAWLCAMPMFFHEIAACGSPATTFQRNVP